MHSKVAFKINFLLGFSHDFLIRFPSASDIFIRWKMESVEVAETKRKQTECCLFDFVLFSILCFVETDEL